MKAIVLHGPDDYRLEDIESPKAGDGEVEIEVTLSGICGTDVHLLEGKNPFANYPIVPGHEYIGIVKQVPAGSALKPGDRVTVFPGVGCGQCEACLEGRTPHCPDFVFTGVSRSGGSFAEVTVASEDAIFALPDSLDDQVAALIEPIAVAVHANRRAEYNTSAGRPQNVVVIGGGTIGLLVAQIARVVYSANVILSEPQKERRDLALEMGIDQLCNPIEQNLPELVKERFGLADIVFDVVAFEQTLLESEEMLRPGGTLVPVGLPAGKNKAIPFELIFKKELRAIGTRTYFKQDYQEAIDLLADDRIVVKPLISALLPMSEFNEGIRLLKTEPQKYTKILVDPKR